MLFAHKLRSAASKLRLERKRPGTPPGTLVYHGEEPVGPVRIHVYDFDRERLEEREMLEPSELVRYRDPVTTTWINIDGVHDLRVVEEVGRIFGVHPLTLEDIVSTVQRPKLEEYPEYIYLVLQMMHYDHERLELKSEQVSLIVTEGVVISFQESMKGDVFDPVRQRLRESRGRIRVAGADFLAYSLVDVIVDYYLVVLEGLGEHIEELEDAVMAGPEPDLMHRITRIRRMVTFMRRTIWPLRDAVLALERSEQPFISETNSIFFRDVYDHAIRTMEMIESAREVLATLTDLHVSALSFRMNEVMKVLAVIATFFLPLTFIAGVYGMNFNPASSPLNMPELNWYFGYPFAWFVMIATALAMWIYFRRKRWM